MDNKKNQDFLCDNCGAEYVLIFDNEDILEEPIFCPFCGYEKDTYDIEDEFQQEFEFDEE